MARNPCNCTGSTCSCKLVSNDGSVQILGKGSLSEPYDLAVNAGHVNVVDTATINLTRTGVGTISDPAVVSADLTADTTDLQDVSATAPTDGQILIWHEATGEYVPGPPVTATPGAIAHDGSLKGDGSAGAQLAARLDPVGLLTLGTNGLGLSAATIAAINRAARVIPPPVRVGRGSTQPADTFPSNYWIQILNFLPQSYPAGWYDISGSLSGWTGGNFGERGFEGWTRINIGSGGGPSVFCNNWDTYRPPGHDGQRTDFWPGISLEWGLKGTYHHTGGELRFAVDTYVEAPTYRDCFIMNQGTGVVLSCISLD